MSFEEDFPSLKVFTISPAIFWKKTHNQVIIKEDIQKHCLDKEKVTKAINEYFNLIHSDVSGGTVVDYYFKRYPNRFKEFKKWLYNLHSNIKDIFERELKEWKKYNFDINKPNTYQGKWFGYFKLWLEKQLKKELGI